MERKTESFERRRCFPRAEPQMPAVPAGWRVDLSLPGMQILHKLYTSSDVGRACVSTRRDVGWNARHEFQPNTAPSSLPLSFLSFFIPPLFFIHARLSIRHACFETNRSEIRGRESQGNIRLHFPPWILDREWRRKIRKSRTSTFN